MKTFTNLKAIVSVTLIMATVTFSSCKKEDKSKSKTEFLTLAGWKEVKYEEKTNNGAWQVIPNTDPACEQDNMLSFKTNNAFEYNEGVTKCSPNDPQIIETGTWAFGANETSLTITISGFPSTLTIEQLDANTLVMITSSTSGGNTYYDRTTFSH